MNLVLHHSVYLFKQRSKTHSTGPMQPIGTPSVATIIL